MFFVTSLFRQIKATKGKGKKSNKERKTYLQAKPSLFSFFFLSLLPLFFGGGLELVK